MKKIKASFFGIAILLCLSASAQEAADTAFEKTVFWQISGNGLKDTSYLFGTAHPIFREDILIADTMLKALLRATAVYFEYVPPANNDSIFKQISIMNKPRLRRLLGSLSYSKLTTLLKEYNDPILTDTLFNWLTPRFYSARIGDHIFGPSLTSLDATLMAVALGNVQQVFSLDKEETRDELMKMWSLDEQANFLYQLIADIEKSTANSIKLVKGVTALYYTGNIGAIYTRNSYLVINDPLGGLSLYRTPLSEKILDKRNKEWIPVMETSMAKQVSFFAVGAAHLAGKDGVISRLRKKGYTLTPVFLSY